MKHFPLLILCLLLNPFFAFSQIITIGPGGDFPNLETAESSISAGDTVRLLDGIFSDGTQFLEDLNGTAAAPIVIEAENQHAAIMQGGTEAIHLINCSHLIIDGLVIEGQTGNGINIDDGGDYSTPTHHITIRNCIFRDMAASGNHDLLKLSGLDSFLVQNCQFLNGADGGSGIDMVGCHWGTIEDCELDEAGVTGIQAKGGTQHILIRRNILKNMDQRAVNLGGSTGLQFFRPPLPDPIVDAFEAADLEVYANVFIGSRAPVAYVGCVRVKVFHNTFYHPENWVIRILQETTEAGFLTCADNEFRNNIILLGEDLTETNVGPNTDPTSFRLSNNLWYLESGGNWIPNLPVTDSNQVYSDPLFVNALNEDFQLGSGSPAIGAGKTLPAPIADFNEQSYNIPPSIGAFEGNPSNTSIEPNRLAEVLFYPNPADTELYLQTNLSAFSYNILQSDGTVVMEGFARSPINQISIEKLSPGIYVLIIQQGEAQGIFKFIKQ